MAVSLMASTTRNFIGGEWVPPSSASTMTRRCPLDHCDLGPYPVSNAEDVHAAVNAAAHAAEPWGRLAPAARAAVLQRMASAIEAHAKELAECITHEEGKRLTEAYGETTYAIGLLRYFAGTILAREGSVVPGSEQGAINLYRHRPLGPVALVTPWNFPLLVAMRKMAPALAYGNSVVWKPASESPETALLFAQLVLTEAQVPAGVVNVVIGNGGTVGDALVQHPLLRAVTFTGSTEVGRRVQRAAFEREDPIRVQVEMGGKNPLIVAEDADLSFAAGLALDGVIKGSGQRCTATGLVLVQASVLDQFLQEAGKRVEGLRVGPGVDPASDVTPLVSRRQLETVEKLLAKSEAAGLARVAEATVPTTSGWYFRPVLAANATPSMPVFTEEIFGPVLPVATYDDDDHAIYLANSLRYGLSASIVTSNVSRALRFVQDMRAGVVKVNQETGSSEPNFPFGGWKASGYGPMEQGEAAMHFFTEEQTVHLAPGPRPQFQGRAAHYGALPAGTGGATTTGEDSAAGGAS
jgi:acyl-CoA reductase-like NAD-dependent aldehyde dehydrogenase